MVRVTKLDIFFLRAAASSLESFSYIIHVSVYKAISTIRDLNRDLTSSCFCRAPFDFRVGLLGPLCSLLVSSELWLDLLLASAFPFFLWLNCMPRAMFPVGVAAYAVAVVQSLQALLNDVGPFTFLCTQCLMALDSR